MKSAALPTVFIIDDDKGMRQAIHLSFVRPASKQETENLGP
jgi:hypothetical protein